MEKNKQSEKTAIVFDTNAIYKLYDRLENTIPKVINNNYFPYIPQLVIYEYKNLFARDFKSETKKMMNKFKPYIEYVDKKNIDDTLQYIQIDIQSRLEVLFKNRIIKYDESSEAFNKIINRALEKIQPFVLDNEKNKSDKGFKDTIIWLSVIEYFKNQGEDNVIFVSDDTVFSSNNSILINEFKSHTNKNITFKTHEEFSKMIAYEDNKKAENIALNNNDLDFEHNEEIHNISDEELARLREAIDHIIYEVCFISTGYNFDMDNTFTLTSKIEAPYVKNMLTNLERNYENHLLEKNIPITEMVGNDEIIQVNYDININSYKELLFLYKEIRQDYPSLLPQFYKVVAKLINHYCYKEPRSNNVNMNIDDEVPF